MKRGPSRPRMVRLPFPTVKFGILACCFAALACSLGAAWSPPSPAHLARLDRALAPQNAQYDPVEQMLRRPFSSPGYHTALTGGFVHPTRD